MIKQASRFAALTTAVLLSTGCALTPAQDDTRRSRKAELTGCVAQFLDKDVSPVDSLNICSSIYSRWNPTTTGKVSDKLVK